MQWKCFCRFSSFAWQRGTLQLIAIHLITLPNILEYMQIAIIQTEAADFVKMNICVILKTFGHDCICCTVCVCVYIIKIIIAGNQVFMPAAKLEMHGYEADVHIFPLHMVLNH